MKKRIIVSVIIVLLALLLYALPTYGGMIYRVYFPRIQQADITQYVPATPPAWLMTMYPK